MNEASPRDSVLAAVARYWGFSELRPLQREAIEAGLAQRDSLVVMPTGGGKSHCYQVPPAVRQRERATVAAHCRVRGRLEAVLDLV